MKPQKTVTLTEDLPTYDSMLACANATGIPMSVIKKQKNAGNQAFTSNRVRLGPLLKGIFANGDAASEEGAEKRIKLADAEIKEAKAKRVSRQNEDDARELAQEIIVATLAPMRTRLLQLGVAIGARCNPDAPEAAREVIEEAIKKILPDAPERKVMK